MSQEKHEQIWDWISYNSILAGLAIFIYWLLQVRIVFAANADKLPVTIPQLPDQILYWVAMVLIIMPFTLLHLRRRIRMMSLGLAVFLVIFSFPLMSPYSLPVGRDAQYALQTAQNMLDSGTWNPGSGTGQAVGYSNYPGLPIYHVLLSGMSGMDLTQAIMWGIPIFRFLLLPVLIFMMFYSLFKNVDISLVSVFIYFSNPSMTNHPHYEGMAIVFMFAMFYLWLLSDLKKSSVFILSLILGFTMVITHHFTSYMMFIWLAFIFAFGLFVTLAARIRIFDRLIPFSQKKVVTFPIAFSIILIGILGVWSLSVGAAQFSTYISGLEDTIFSRLNPQISPDEPPPIQISPINVSGPSLPEIKYDSPVMLSSVYSLAENDPEVERSQSIGTPNLVLLKVQGVFQNIGDGVKKIVSLLQLGNFKNSELAIVFMGLSVLGILMLIGFFARREEATFFELANIAFFGLFILIGVMLSVVGRLNIMSRIFEFAYIGFIPFAVAGLIWITNKEGVLRQVVFTVVLVLLFAMGNLLLVGGQQRYFYVPEDKFILDSSFMFLSPGTYEMTKWAKTNFEGKDIIGESYAFDTIGAFGATRVHYYEPRLIQRVYQPTNLITDRARFQIKWDNGEAIVTHKYLTFYPSHSGGPYPTDSVEKFNSFDWLNKVYDSNTFQFFSVEEHIS